ncbi:MAG: non-heme iron oxygenase ferredoxin subunit [Dehalococcoidia bacterium]
MAEFVKVASTADVTPGKMHAYQVNGRQILVCNVEGTYYAIDNLCTHDGGTLDEGELDGEQVECPRHGALFDVKTGRPMALPAVQPVQAYPVQVEGDEIRVQVEE